MDEIRCIPGFNYILFGFGDDFEGFWVTSIHFGESMTKPLPKFPGFSDSWPESYLCVLTNSRDARRTSRSIHPSACGTVIQMEQPADIKLTRDDKPERKFFENPLTWHLGLWHKQFTASRNNRSLTASLYPPEKGPFQEDGSLPIISFQGWTPKFRGVHVLWVILTASLDLLCLWVNFYKPLRKVSP